MTPKEKIIKSLQDMGIIAEKNVGKKIMVGQGWSITFGIFLFTQYCNSKETFPYYNGVEIKLSTKQHICSIILEHQGDINYRKSAIVCGHSDCLEDEDLAADCLLE